jgi:translation initiation factor 3 subunit M
MASSIIVNTADAAELRLVHYLGDHDATSGFVQACESSVREGDASSLIRTVISYPPAIKKIMADKEEGSGAFSLLAALMDRLPNHDEVHEFTRVLVNMVEDAESDVDIKVNLLCNLYNLREGKDKSWILGRILNAYIQSSDDEAVLNLLPERKSTIGELLQGNNLERFLIELQNEDKSVSFNDEKRQLFGIASELAGKLSRVCSGNNMDKEAANADSTQQRFLLKMLGTYDESSVDEHAIQSATQAAVGAIRDPVTLFNEQRCILSLPPVAALNNFPDTKPLYSLLSIFQQGKLDEFETFVQSNKSVMSSFQIDESEAIRHMRLLSLCSLATEHEEIPYEAIATTLKIDKTNVESWVIDGVSSGLLTAKIDQLQAVVIVENCVVRRFGVEQWKILQHRLNLWKDNVKNVLESLKKSQKVGSA